MQDAANGCVDNNCCECWKNGCGLDGAFGLCADCLEGISPGLELVSDAIWCLGSPLAFPCIFCFSPDPENTDQPAGPGGGWALPMLSAPASKPVLCCAATLCPCAGQWYARYQALGGDMTRYKLWQGQHDGPQCCARRCPSAPITIQSGTYGEQDCPQAFLCLEVCCLGGINSLCCAHYVTRRLIQEERSYLGQDPTEIRQEKCAAFFGTIMRQCCCIAMCLRVSSCCLACCAVDSEGAQECGANGQRASRACFQIGWTLWRGIQSVRLLAIGCMVAQQSHELQRAIPSAPEKPKMER